MSLSWLQMDKISSEILNFWKEHQIFEKSISERENHPPYIFYEGPPSANGMPGIHHVMARTIKDIFCRYKTQKGYKVNRKAGWDTHGLPVELGVEKALGITKDDIGKSISVEEYNTACKEAVMKYTDVWNRLTQEMGYWVDMDDPYVTYTSKYMETVWWLIKQIYEKGQHWAGLFKSRGWGLSYPLKLILYTSVYTRAFFRQTEPRHDVYWILSVRY